MTIPEIPKDPFSLVPSRPVKIAGQRTASVFGAPVELVCLPDRDQRGGIPNDQRPSFLPNRAPDILKNEGVWEAPGVVMTGNAFPFASRQAIFWATERCREPSLAMLRVAYASEDAVAGTTIVNSMGASGSITRSHIHLLGSCNDFLGALPQSRIEPSFIGLASAHLGDCELWRLDLPFPIMALGVRGSASQRAQAMHRLLECRSTPAFNLVSSNQTSWLIPRSTIETPAPHFQQALGGAELWGRWCFANPKAFEQATEQDLEAAIRLAGTSWP